MPNFGACKNVTPENAARLGIDRQQCLDNLAKLRQSLDIHSRKLVKSSQKNANLSRAIVM